MQGSSVRPAAGGGPPATFAGNDHPSTQVRLDEQRLKHPLFADRGGQSGEIADLSFAADPD